MEELVDYLNKNKSDIHIDPISIEIPAFDDTIRITYYNKYILHLSYYNGKLEIEDGFGFIEDIIIYPDYYRFLDPFECILDDINEIIDKNIDHLNFIKNYNEYLDCNSAWIYENMYTEPQDTYITVNYKKFVSLINDLNQQITSLQNQLYEPGQIGYENAKKDFES